MLAVIFAGLYIRAKRRKLKGILKAKGQMKVNWEHVPKVPKNKKSARGPSASSSNAGFKAPPNFKAPPPKGAQMHLRREMSPDTARRFMGLLAAGHFADNVEAAYYVTVTAAPTPVPSVLSMIVNWNTVFYVVLYLFLIVGPIVIMKFACFRNRKVCVYIDVAVQVDLNYVPDLVFTPHGNCYHIQGCETITNWRRNATTMVRRPCLYCLPHGINGEPEAEQ
jgi:hypothetical protein